MTAVVQMEATTGAARALASAEGRYLSVFDAPWDKQTLHEMTRLHAWFSGGSEHVSPSAWAKASEAVALVRFTDPADAERYASDVARALSAYPDAAAARGMIGLLVEAYPTQRPTAAFCETVLHDVVSTGVTPHELARGCQTVRRTSKFLPALSEILTACNEARKELESLERSARRFAMMLSTARAIAAMPKPAPHRSSDRGGTGR